MPQMFSFRRALRILGTTVAALSVLVVSSLNGVTPAQAGGPAFNNMNGDQPTLTVGAPGDAGTTKWQTHLDGVHIGDVVSMMVWKHNTELNTTAVNTKVQVQLANNTSNFLISHATVSADNAPTAGGSVILNTFGAAHLAYIADSAQFYMSDGTTLKKQDFPSTVTDPNQIVTTGINLGDQDGCWDHLQAIIIQVRVEGTTPAIMTNKQVALNSSSLLGNSANAHPGDIVSFRIYMQNTGNATGTDTQISDQLDSHFTYIPGSSFIIIKRKNQDNTQKLDDAKITNVNNKLTWKFGDMPPVPDYGFYLYFNVKVNDASQFNVGDNTLQNCAVASFTGVSATTNCVTVSVNKPQQNTYSFTILKEVTNLTLGDSKWYDSDALASAKPGDEVMYRLGIVNTGTAPASNVLVKDLLPAGIQYEGSMLVTSASNPNGTTVNTDDIVKNGYTIASLTNGNANGEAIKFKAKVVATCSNQSLMNVAQVWYNGTKQAESQAGIINSCTNGLIIKKEILDPHDNTFKHDAGTISGAQTVTYRITVLNNGTSTLVNPMARDTLPATATYVPGSLKIDNETQAKVGEDAFFNQGIILTNLTPGLGKTITFQVKLGDCGQYITADVLNTAYAKANNVGEISDTAHAVVQNACGGPTPTPTPGQTVSTTTTTPTSTPTLPKTGPETGALILSLFGASGATRFYLGKRKLKKALGSLDIL